jgi:hypothetical protein
MTFARQLFAAVLAASLVWTGSAGAAQGHTHEIDEQHGAAIHVTADTVNLHRHAEERAHVHDHVAPASGHHDGSEHEPDSHEHEKGVFHVHSLCLIALEAQYPALARALAVQAVKSPLLTVPVHTRSITPADRPPRTLL